MAIEERSPIPVEWVDAEEWDAIEQALAAAATSSAEERNSDLGDGQTTRPRRTLPSWSQKKRVTEDVIPVKIEPVKIGPEVKIEPEVKVEAEVKPVVVQTNLSRLTDSWAKARFMCKGKVHSRSQHLQFKGRVVYSTTSAEVDAAAHEIWEMISSKRAAAPGNVAVGFDLEWKTSFQRGGGAGKVAVVQLCLDSSRCDVLHVAHSGIPPSLATLLEDPSIAKELGRAEMRQSCSDYGIQTRGVVDLAELANQKLGRRWQSWSLSSLAEELTCKKVEKVSSIRCGDWEACPLSSPQLQYAATDAFASLYLYQILETFSNHSSKNEDFCSDPPPMQQATNEL